MMSKKKETPAAPKAAKKVAKKKVAKKKPARKKNVMKVQAVNSRFKIVESTDDQRHIYKHCCPKGKDGYVHVVNADASIALMKAHGVTLVVI